MWYRIDRVTHSRTQVVIEHGVDAIHAASPYHALLVATHRNWLKHGQLFRAVFCYTNCDFETCIRISRERDQEIREFEEFMSLEQGQERL